MAETISIKSLLSLRASKDTCLQRERFKKIDGAYLIECTKNDTHANNNRLIIIKKTKLTTTIIVIVITIAITTIIISISSLGPKQERKKHAIVK